LKPLITFSVCCGFKDSEVLFTQESWVLLSAEIGSAHGATKKIAAPKG